MWVTGIYGQVPMKPTHPSLPIVFLSKYLMFFLRKWMIRKLGQFALLKYKHP